MASQAEIDLVVNASNTLNQLQSDLDRVVAAAQATADPVQLQAAINLRSSIDRMRRELDEAIAAVQATDPEITVDVDVDRDAAARRILQGLQGVLGRVGSTATDAARSIGTLGVAAGGAVPLLAGVAVAVESIIPAAAVAATGILALQAATLTLKLGMQGVEEAISSAFDPDVKPEDLEKQLKRLAPEARSFVRELRSMRGAFRTLQLGVQNQLFENFDNVVRQLGRSALPTVRTALTRVSGSFNEMARRAAAAAIELSDRGVLGSALTSVTRSFQNLRDVPAQATTSFGLLAAAAGPALEKISLRVRDIATRISEDLTNAFAEGRLERAIDQAFSNLAQLGRSVRNVFAGIGNIFGSLTQDGRGLFQILEDLSEAFRDITASEGFRDALGALASVADNLVSNVGPLLKNIFEELGPVFERLAPPVNRLLDLLGEQLNGVVDELGPVLVEASEAFDKISAALEPVIELLFEIIREILPTLQPGIQLLGEIFEQLRPGIERITEALGPLISKLFELQTLISEQVFQALGGLLERISPLINEGLAILAAVIENAVIPTIQIFIDLLNGDTTTAFNRFIDLGNRVNEFVSAAFNLLKTKVQDAIRNMVTDASARFARFTADLVATAQQKLAQVVSFFATLPSRIAGALGNLGSLLFSAGQDIVEGLIQGARSKINELVGTLASIASRARETVTSILGIHSPSTVFAEIGDNIVEGLIQGINRSVPDLRRELGGFALAIPGVAGAAGSTLTAPARQLPDTNVTVMIGNSVLNRHIDTRIETNNRRRDLVASQGVRR